MVAIRGGTGGDGELLCQWYWEGGRGGVTKASLTLKFPGYVAFLLAPRGWLVGCLIQIVLLRHTAREREVEVAKSVKFDFWCDLILGASFMCQLHINSSMIGKYIYVLMDFLICVLSPLLFYILFKPTYSHSFWRVGTSLLYALFTKKKMLW